LTRRYAKRRWIHWIHCDRQRERAKQNAFVVQQYDGAPRPLDSIAIIRVDAGEAIVFFDGEPLRAIRTKVRASTSNYCRGVHQVENLVNDVDETGVRVRFVANAA